MFEITEFLTVIKPLVYLSEWFGLAPFTIIKINCFERVTRCSRLYFTYSLFATISVIGSGLWATWHILSIIDKTSVIAGIIITRVSLFANISIYFSRFVYKRRMNLLIAKIDSFNNTLSIYPCPYRQMFLFNIGLVCIIIPLPVVKLIWSFILYEYSFMEYVLCLGDTLAMVFVSLVEYQFFNLVFLIRMQFSSVNSDIFQALNSFIKGASNETEINSTHRTKELFQFEQIPSNHAPNYSSNGVEYILKFRKQYDEICDILEVTNEMFSLELLAFIAYHFVALTSLAYTFAYIILGQDISDLFWNPTYNELYFWPLWQIGHILTVILVCDAVSLQGNYISVLTNKFLNLNINEDIKNELKIFSQQLLNRKVQFTACGFFVLDRTLLYSIVGAVTTYTVIMIQFQLSGNK